MPIISGNVLDGQEESHRAMNNPIEEMESLKAIVYKYQDRTLVSLDDAVTWLSQIEQARTKKQVQTKDEIRTVLLTEQRSLSRARHLINLIDKHSLSHAVWQAARLSVLEWKITKLCESCGIEKPVARYRFGRYESKRRQYGSKCIDCRKSSSAKSATRRARKLGAPGTYSDNDVKAIYKSQLGNCWWCGEQVGNNFHVDHRVPLSRGGSNRIDNLVISCPPCNLSKGPKLPSEWNGRLL